VFGFERWALFCLGGRGFHWIFDYDPEKEQIVPLEEAGKEERRFFPNWDASQARAEEAISLAKTLDNLWAFNLVPPIPEYLDKLRDATEVLDFFRKNRGKHIRSDWGLNLESGKPPVAIIWRRGYFGPEAAIIYEAEKNPHLSCIKILEDTLSFIDLGRSKNGWVIWSGKHRGL
jgi:hypothetical protein